MEDRTKTNVNKKEIVFPCKNCAFPSLCVKRGLTGRFIYSTTDAVDSIEPKKCSKVGFVPPDLWKGQIARATSAMSTKYPQYSNLIHSRVLDSTVAKKWNLLYTPTPIELEWQNVIKQLQNEL